MFVPLGFVPGGGWAAAGVPTVEHYAKVGASPT